MVGVKAEIAFGSTGKQDDRSRARHMNKRLQFSFDNRLATKHEAERHPSKKGLSTTQARTRDHFQSSVPDGLNEFVRAFPIVADHQNGRGLQRVQLVVTKFLNKYVVPQRLIAHGEPIVELAQSAGNSLFIP